MINRFRQIIEGRENVFKNFIALGVLQGTNFLIPLIIMPYLITVIGIDGYGFVSFVQAIMIYFYSFTDYGFAITATKEIAVNKEDTVVLSKVFSKVVTTKLFLILLAAILFFPIVYFIPELRKEWLMYTLGFVLVLGQTTLPVWLFQGMEQMKFITYINFSAKILFTLFIFMFINQPDDYPFVLLFFGLGNFISGLFGFWYGIKKFNLSYEMPSFVDIKDEIQKGWSIFLANFSVVSYMNSNIFILGLFTSDLITGYYSLAEKVVMAMRQILVVFSQAIYPHTCQLAEKSHKELKRFFKQIYSGFISLYTIGVLLVFWLSDWIVSILSGESGSQATILLKLLCFSALFVGFNIPANITLLIYDFKKSYLWVMMAGSVLNIILNVILANLLGAKGTAYSVLITEGFIVVGLYLILRVKHSNYKLL